MKAAWTCRTWDRRAWRPSLDAVGRAVERDFGLPGLEVEDTGDASPSPAAFAAGHDYDKSKLRGL